MARTYKKGADDVLMNDSDLELMARYTADYERARAEGNQGGMAAAHDAAEKLRASYGYSGGSDGSEYIKVPQQESFSYAEAPTYVSRYADTINSLADSIMNRGPFSYDYQTDPQWQSYKKQYTREGQRAAADTMGQYAAMTGGMPSSAAITASQQAGDYYMAQMADKIPELYRAAYDMYITEGNQMRQNLAMYQGLEDVDYQRYLNSLDQYNTDRNFAYNQFSDDRGWNYQLGRDAVADARYADETAYSRGLDDYNRRVALAQMGANLGDYSGMRELGLDTAAANGTRYAYAPDGSSYEIGSYQGRQFIESAAPGQTMTGGDGSVWTKNADGSVSISRGGKTYTVAGAQTAAGGYSSGGSDEGEEEAGGTIYDQLAEAGATDYGTAYEMLRRLGYSATDANRYAKYFGDTFYPGMESEDEGTAAESEGEADTRPVNTVSFFRSVFTALRQGNEDFALQELDRIWPRLTDEQREDLNRVMLQQYGFQYEN